jgi:anti-sigma-K factor RskA
MTAENDLHPHDDLAIYALDALDPDERAAIEEHLAACPTCRAELEEHRTTLARLVTPAEEPPPSVWAGIAQQLPQLGGDHATVRSPLPDADDPAADRGADRGADVVPLHAPRHARRRRSVSPGGWLAAAAALVVVLGLGAVLVARSGDDSPSSVADLAAAAADAPGAVVIPLEDDDGNEVARVVLAADDSATDFVLLDNLAQLPATASYQLWETGSVAPVSLGVLGDGSVKASAIAAPADVTSLALSQEPRNGVPQPTGPIVATGTRA